MEQILASSAPFTALLASNDRSAIGAIQTLSKAGLLVPQDVAVIGFDDRLEATAHVPSLTTVRYPAFEEGYQGVALLLEYIKGRAEGVGTVQVPTQLIVRESCGCLIGVPTAGALANQAQQDAAETSVSTETTVFAKTNVSAASGEHGSGQTVSDVVQVMAAIMGVHVQRLNLDEVQHLCRRLVEAFVLSLKQRDGMALHLTVQQVLQRIMSLGDDLHAWQTAISILRDNVPALLAILPDPPARRQAEDILDRARLVISEVAHEQYTRHLIRQIDVADQVGRMTSHFLAAQDEAGIFAILSDSLPKIGIQHASVIFYEPEEDDPVAWGVLQASSVSEGSRRRFPSRQFPPEGLYPKDRPFSLALLPLRIQEDVFGLVAFDSGNLEPCADIVRQLAAALRGVRLYREAVEARQLAEERRQLAEDANRLKSRFLSMVSHELRTPLNLICGLSNMLLQESERVGQGECRVNRSDVERIYIGAQHLDALIRDVLDLARSDVGQLRLVCEPLNLVEVLKAVSVIGEKLAQDKDLAWRAEIPENLPWIWGDRTRLRQVTLNLVNNAIKFTARGEVALKTSVEDGHVTVAVQDTGLGVPVDEHSVIFDEFRQSGRTTARGYGGLGLGLAICKRLVEMHGGAIGVRSSGEEGAGSTFYFTLPVMEQRAISSAERPPAQARQALLLVKDAQGADLLQDHLAQQGFEVEVHQVGARDAPTTAMDWLARLVLTPPDAVVLDLGLTSERGWEVLKIIKENPATRDVPVLFYTLADDDSGSLLELNYITKPVGTVELAEALLCQGLLGEKDSAEAKNKVLIVDDDPGVLEIHARMVEAQSPNYQILRAHNGIQALDVIRQERPDLVLLDLMMPELDGFGVLEAMREEEMSRNIPVIVLTGQVLTEEDMARLNRGVASVLGKGLFSVEETLEHVASALERRQRAGPEAQRLVLKAMAYIHTHYAEPVSRSDIATYVGLSERHLTRCFRQEMGVTPIAYLNRYRVRQAKALLEAGDKSITEVAMEVGFSTGGYFTRVFRQEVGVSPRAYQQGEDT
jgi:signal transduction histidine kinase/DNA-binding response OmpR family regulator